MDTKKTSFFIVCLRDRSASSECENHSRFKSQHNREGIYDHSMSTQILLLIKNKIFIKSSENCEANGDRHDLYCTNRALHILQEVDAERKVFK